MQKNRLAKEEIISRLTPIRGFDDRIGLVPRIQRQIEGNMRALFEKSDYQEYIPPTLERAEVYGRGVFQDSPWIEGTRTAPKGWEETVNREFLPITLRSFKGDAQVRKGDELAILRPEGTASLCRHIAKGIVEKNQFPGETNPLKVYYMISCFRNEGVENLSSMKRREFNQIGVEYMGAKGLDADVEAFYLGFEGLKSIVKENEIVLRVSDTNIFRELCRRSEFDLGTKIELKENIDSFSKARVMGRNAGSLKNEIERKLNGLPGSLRDKWEMMYTLTGDRSAIEEMETRAKIRLGTLKAFYSRLKEMGVQVRSDLAMIRGWEYYTGIIGQFDIETRKKTYAEVGGGGRYDGLVGNFLDRCGIKKNIPATGFAFGTERLVQIALEGMK